jgi:hypothetical protein
VVLEAEFLNPYEARRGWAYGIYLRGGPNFYQRIAIDSTGGWRHDYRPGPGKRVVTLRSEGSADIDRSTSGRNRMRLVIIRRQGWLYINGHLQDQIDLTATPFDSTRLFVTREKDNEVTEFSDFTAWTWVHPGGQAPAASTPSPAPVAAPTPAPQPAPTVHAPDVPLYGPVDGVIIHDIQKPSNFFEPFTGPTLDHDIMAEVIFHNPYPISEESWNYGFLLRNDRSNVYHWLYLDSRGEWVHQIRLGPDHATLAYGNSRITNLDTTAGGSNKIRIVIIGDRLWTFINDEFQRTSDLRPIQDVAPITLVVNDLREGETNFEGFTVWKWHPSLQELPEPSEQGLVAKYARIRPTNTPAGNTRQEGRRLPLSPRQPNLFRFFCH